MYPNNTDDISLYYTHAIAVNRFNSKFYFDKGLVFAKDKINIGAKDWALIKKEKDRFYIATKSDFIADEFIRFPDGSQGLNVFNNNYKILWGYMNFDKFYFSDKKVMIDFNWVIISSNNKQEMLYLLSLLNSNLSKFLFNSYLKTENEQAILLGIKSIKQYIRIPKITSENQFIKDEIIKTTEQMLDLEKATLRDIVNFNGVQMQQFNKISVVGNNLVLDSMTLEIPDNYAESVKSALKNKYFHKNGNPLLTEIRLSELKTLPVIDFEYQRKLKDYIDDLVFALYFNVPVKNIGINHAGEIKQMCQENEFYSCINAENG